MAFSIGFLCWCVFLLCRLLRNSLFQLTSQNFFGFKNNRMCNTPLNACFLAKFLKEESISHPFETINDLNSFFGKYKWIFEGIFWISIKNDGFYFIWPIFKKLCLTYNKRTIVQFIYVLKIAWNKPNVLNRHKLFSRGDRG